MLPDSDRTRLLHIVEAALEAISFAEGRTLPELESDRQLLHSLVRCIEIVGEASSRLSPGFRDAHPGLPWVDMREMRNRLIHAYFDIKVELVWKTVVDELPGIVREVQRILDT